MLSFFKDSSTCNEQLKLLSTTRCEEIRSFHSVQKQVPESVLFLPLKNKQEMEYRGFHCFNMQKQNLNTSGSHVTTLGRD